MYKIYKIEVSIEIIGLWTKQHAVFFFKTNLRNPLSESKIIRATWYTPCMHYLVSLLSKCVYKVSIDAN